MAKKIRALRNIANNVGLQRYNLYKAAINRVNFSIQNGFYLEAISILESLISDRLESYLMQTNMSNGFETLGSLINKFSNESNLILKNFIQIDLNQWRQKRNQALHEMVKLEENSTYSWADRTKSNQKIAEEGILLFRNLDKLV